jgi:phosphate transport system substrate-binding protein
MISPLPPAPVGLGLVATLSLGLLAAGCDGPSARSTRTTIQNVGSDTMVHIAAVWAEAYSEIEPGVSVEVSGGGSGQGVAALINGSCDLANSSRHLEDREIETLKTRTGQEPREFVVGYDALCVFVHRNNPLEEITMEQLADIYRYDGRTTHWAQLGVTVPGAKGDEIIRISRQNNSGTYHYFKEAVVGKRHEFKLGSIDMNGSKDVVELISRTPNAIGYCGLGYATPAVKILKVRRTPEETAILPCVASVLDKTYPIARPMFVYTAGEPTPIVQAYIDWILSPAGQTLVEETGYIPHTPP